MDNGLHILGFGFFAMRSREDLGNPNLQRALERCHGDSSRIQCACRYSEGVDLPMEAVRMSARNVGPIRYRVDRRSREDLHDPSCIHKRKDDEETRDLLGPTIGMFDPPKESAVSVSASSALIGGQWTVFRAFARRAWSAGYAESFAAVNRNAYSVLEMRNPTAAEIFWKIEEQFRHVKFENGLDGYEAAKSVDLEFVFGILGCNLGKWRGQETSEEEAPIYAWVAKGGRLGHYRLLAPVSLLASVCGSVMAFGHVMEPPYLFAGVLEPGNHLRVAVVAAVLYDGYDLVPVDSRGERGLFRTLLNARQVFFRGLDSLRDYEQRVPSRLQLCTLPGGGGWPFNPDALVYGSSGGEVVECRGFTESPEHFGAYHAAFERKRRYYETLLAGTQVRFREEISEHYRDVSLTRPDLGGESVVREYPEQPLWPLARL